MSDTPTEALARVCPACGSTPLALARFCQACGAPIPPPERVSVERGLRTRWVARVQDPPVGPLLALGPFVVCVGGGGMLHVFHESSPTPRLSRRLPAGEYHTPAALLDGVLVAASSRSLVAVDLVPLLMGRRVAVPRDRTHGLPGPPVSWVATDREGRVAVACSAGPRTEVHLFQAEPRRGLEARKVLSVETLPGEERWHLWLAGDRLLAGQPGGSVRTWSLAGGVPMGDLPIPGGLGGFRLQRSAAPVALTADETLLLLEPELPEGTRMLYRPDTGTVWAWTLAGQELYASLDRSCVRVATDSAASASVDLPGQGYSVLPPLPVAEGALVLTQDGHLSLLAPQAGTLRIRWAERLFDGEPARVGPASTSRTVFLWVPGTGIQAMEPVP